MGKLIYELPNEKNKIIKIVDSIPSNWWWIDGFLIPTRDLYNKDQIVKNTHLSISQRKVTILGKEEFPYEDQHEYPGGRAKDVILPSIYDIILGGKLPFCVAVDEADFVEPMVSVEDVKKLMKGFIEIGYKVWLTAYSQPESWRVSRYNRPESLNISSKREIIELEWSKEFGGKKENLDGIIKKIEQLGLTQISQQEKVSA